MSTNLRNGAARKANDEDMSAPVDGLQRLHESGSAHRVIHHIDALRRSCLRTRNCCISGAAACESRHFAADQARLPAQFTQVRHICLLASTIYTADTPTCSNPTQYPDHNH